MIMAVKGRASLFFPLAGRLANVMKKSRPLKIRNSSTIFNNPVLYSLTGRKFLTGIGNKILHGLNRRETVTKDIQMSWEKMSPPVFWRFSSILSGYTTRFCTILPNRWSMKSIRMVLSGPITRSTEE